MNKLDIKLTEKEKFDEEPSLRIGISSAAVAGIVNIILYFIPGISDEYLTILTVVLVIGVPILSAVLIRKRVWSPASVNEIVEIVAALAKAGNGKTQVYSKTNWDTIENRSKFKSGRAPIPPMKSVNPKFPEE